MQLITPLLAEITWSVILLAIAFVFICLFMMMIILIQKPKGGGLSGAFGGAGGGESSFVGAKVGDFLTIVTVVCFILFLGLAMALTWKINPTENQAKLDAEVATETAAAGEAAATEGGDTLDPGLETETMDEASNTADDASETAEEAAGEITTFDEAAETVSDETAEASDTPETPETPESSDAPAE